ncbi:MAG: hypothetical protein GF383_00435 [Candidatus Lokiarchaeota archaeon]|nr:hypothetical protein [Candidatus Lokiarchaeota archaeon]
MLIKPWSRLEINHTIPNCHRTFTTTAKRFRSTAIFTCCKDAMHLIFGL